MRQLAAIFAALCVSTPAIANDEWEVTGFAGFEYRQFLQSAKLPRQHSGTAAPSMVLEPEIYKQTDTDTFTARFFLRADAHDDERTHGDIRQLDWVRAVNDWEIRAGISKVFWGVTESQHLVDIINQTDFVENVDGEDKLGQPLIQFATFQNWGDLRFYYLPYFRERTFTGRKGRLRGPLIVDTNRAEYTNDAEELHPDVALRYSHYIGAWDIGLAHFHGTSREPILRDDGNGRLIPVYEVIDQSSLDLQYTTGSWLWKLEAIGRAGHGDYFGAAVGGFEYTFYTVTDSGMDVGILAEYHRDGRKHTAPGTSFDNDIFLGTRLTLNDAEDTQFLAGGVADTNDGSQSFFVEASTRLNDHVTVEIEGRFQANVDRSQAAFFSRDDDYLQLQLNYYF